MNQPFSPHPQWRKHFAYTTQYPKVETHIVIEPAPVASTFTLDPIINKWSVPVHEQGLTKNP